MIDRFRCIKWATLVLNDHWRKKSEMKSQKLKSKKFKSEFLSLIHDRTVVVIPVLNEPLQYWIWSLKKQIQNEIWKVGVRSLKSAETMSLEIWKYRLLRLCLRKCQNIASGDYVSDFLYKIFYKKYPLEKIFSVWHTGRQTQTHLLLTSIIIASSPEAIIIRENIEIIISNFKSSSKYPIWDIGVVMLGMRKNKYPRIR